jgi:hypothetical protein
MLDPSVVVHAFGEVQCCTAVARMFMPRTGTFLHDGTGMLGIVERGRLVTFARAYHGICTIAAAGAER